MNLKAPPALAQPKKLTGILSRDRSLGAEDYAQVVVLRRELSSPPFCVRYRLPKESSA